MTIAFVAAPPTRTAGRWTFRALFLLLAMALWPAAAQASGDFGCEPEWKLRHPGFTGCDNMVMLSPGNDTRVNLALLLTKIAIRNVPRADDDSPPAPLFDWSSFSRSLAPAPVDAGSEDHAAGEGSRCRSDAGGRQAFATALAEARGLRPGERTALAAARQGLRPTCTGSPPVTVATAPYTSRAARAFGEYLRAATAFYAGDFDTAAGLFTALADDRQPWLRETARYMLGRVEVNRAQVGAFDEYGYRDDRHPVDARIVGVAEARLHAYLRDYPRGRYAQSARGLLRRVYWLGGQTGKLAAEYAELFAQAPDARGLDDVALIDEIDDKLLPNLTIADAKDPVLLAILDLRAMRRDGEEAAPALTRAALEAQRPLFARTTTLFDHLLATYAFWVDGDAQAVLALIPDAGERADIDATAFSRRMLRGMALDASGDRDARRYWLARLSGATPPQRLTVELALALHDERRNGLDRIFAAGSPVGDATIRDILLTNVADAALLRRQAADATASAHERAVALFTLLYKSVTRGAWRDFLSDVQTLPASAPNDTGDYAYIGSGTPPLAIFVRNRTGDFACPLLRETARRLATDPQAATARLCLAEFVRLNDLDDYLLDTQPPGDELGGTPSRFPGRAYSRLEAYKAVLATPRATAPRTTDDDRAYALYRAINCYAPSRMNGCGGVDVEPPVRKAWFQRLHREFAASRWARKSEYYW